MGERRSWPTVGVMSQSVPSRENAIRLPLGE